MGQSCRWWCSTWSSSTSSIISTSSTNSSRRAIATMACSLVVCIQPGVDWLCLLKHGRYVFVYEIRVWGLSELNGLPSVSHDRYSPNCNLANGSMWLTIGQPPISSLQIVQFGITRYAEIQSGSPINIITASLTVGRSQQFVNNFGKSSGLVHIETLSFASTVYQQKQFTA